MKCISTRQKSSDTKPNLMTIMNNRVIAQSMENLSFIGLMVVAAPLTLGLQINTRHTFINFLNYSHPYALIWDRTFINL